MSPIDESGNGTNTSANLQISAIRVAQIILYFPISITGTAGNMFIFYKIIHRNKRRVGEYLILNLAVTDLATCVISIPFDLAERLSGGFPFGSILCFIVYPLQTVLMAVSVITLLSMSLERRRIVMAPIRPRLKPKMAKIAICVSWVAPTLVIIPYALVLRLDGKQCLEKWPEHWYVKVFTLTDFVLFFVLPFVLITSSYFRAGRTVRRQLQRLDAMMEGVSRSKLEYTRKRALQKQRITRTFVIAVVVFFLCMLPTHVAWIWSDFAQGWKNKHFQDVVIFSNILMYLNSALNPFIFGSLQRHSITDLIGCCCQTLSGNTSKICAFALSERTPTCSIERQKAIRADRPLSVNSTPDNYVVHYESYV